MADKLVEMYQEWANTHHGNFTALQIFQAGFTASAVSMRQRAVKVAQTGKDKNDVINKIGSLSDIPWEE